MAIEFDGKGNIEATTPDGVIAVKLYSLEKTIEQKDKEMERLREEIVKLNGELRRYKSIVYLCEKVKDCDKE